MSAFVLERSEGGIQNKPKSKPTNENNSTEEDGSSKKRRFAVVESKAEIDPDSSTGTKNTSITRVSSIQLIHGNLQGKTGPEAGYDI